MIQVTRGPWQGVGARGVDRGAWPLAGVHSAPPLPQAKTSGKFSREELDKLWREFQHHREKVREYNVLLETLSRTEGASGPRPSLRAALAPERSRRGGTPCWFLTHPPSFLSGDLAVWDPSGCL